MQKTINHIFETAKLGGFEVKEITSNKSGVTVWLEKDYIFFKCFFENKNTEISHYSEVMEKNYFLEKGITLNKY